ncbi:Gluconate 2-dehydrogenase cytochrome c subunit precursor [Serratia entomophila]|uniref:c-type cytochrome n=1 Tax=Serratia entomophila TaxID=42906 RepID=UPI001F1F5230|nr:cytochrome c [Serratia entomophila]UIW16250.1 cytochrome c [Serratia entomophila]CAI0709073.1 Gluconate 2-dehydrogenase cytochrome c subunit precursor [Serratia entomophila]CAI0855217.1 Gluconate 2-dehydrogenase cytochrome c subunit precursor [Serratia entomophila]CAI0871914.1 Gluconate 2-dehydrogenase cytochrome c subunit precursor [Serratia entomophila]CAI0891388.1 Gluconate 2-dehydrogenase cytochrome c subunit precursor [Serratia entomophila]
MSKIKKIAGWAALTAIAAAVAGGIASWRPEIAPRDVGEHQVFSQQQIERGKMLADLGDCSVCHTRPGGERNTGGLAMEIPFGTIYTTNITPDMETGIGKWSYAAFERAMRHGVDREGNYLYPAFPYTAFTRTRDEDLQALYAYLMSQPAVKYQPPATALSFPFNIRQGIVAWNWLYLTPGAMQNDAGQSAEWNRGAYLAEGLGHCSACHSPRNLLFGEKTGADHLAGGVAEEWTAPSLTGSSAAPLGWTQQDLVSFMRTGYSANHGVAAGPMAPVVEEGLSRLPEPDLQAIATYLRSYHSAPHKPGEAQRLNAQAERQLEPLASQGARLFSGACMACHAQEKGAQMAGVRPALALNTNLYSATPDNAIRVILDGIQHPAKAELGYMPAFRHNLSDEQIAALLDYLRQNYAGQAPWPDLQQRIGQLRAATAEK